MEKFKENKIASIASIIMVVIFIIGFFGLIVVGIIGALFGKPMYVFLIFIPAILLATPFMLISFTFSTRDAYTREFIKYINGKIEAAVTISDYVILLNEFEDLAIDGTRYCLSFPAAIKKLHNKILTAIETLKKQ